MNRASRLFVKFAVNTHLTKRNPYLILGSGRAKRLKYREIFLKIALKIGLEQHF